MLGVGDDEKASCIMSSWTASVSDWPSLFFAKIARNLLLILAFELKSIGDGRVD